MVDFKIRTYPDPFLKQRAKEIDEFSPAIKAFADRMLKKMYEADGIGLAAPQVGYSVRLIVLNPELKPGAELTLANPRVVEASPVQDWFEEGCLSVPQVRAEVKRPVQVLVRALDITGKSVSLRAGGLLARVLQHEIDHLDGILFIDRLTFTRRQQIAAQLKALAGR